MPSHSIPQRPRAVVPLGIFFFFGCTMAAYAAFTLGVPGTPLDRLWALNPEAHLQLAPLGRIMALPFALLSAAMFLTGIAWFKRRRWGYLLGTAIIAVNLAGDAFNMLRGEWLKGGTGVVIAGLLLMVMTRPAMRRYFSES